MLSRKLSRRSLLVGGLLAGTALATSRARAIEYGGQGMPWAAGVADPPYYGLESDTFFTPAERLAVDAITARLIPTDETGPGAREADVVTFIDRQLAGYYGRAQRWYMQGPFPDPLDTQGYQSPHTPSALWREGLAALHDHCIATHGRAFVELDDAEQDAVLKAMQEDELDFGALSASTFFEFALEMTIEGFFSDPVYGGNRGMVGWQLVGFPGARYDYRDYLGHGGAAIEMPPVGLMGRPGWNSN